MGILLSVISLLYLILIFMAKYIPYPNGPLRLFQFILLLNMLTAWLSTYRHTIPSTTIVLSLSLLLYLAIRQQAVLRHQPDGRYFVKRLTYYISAISCLCIGSGLLASLVPPFISLLFQFLYLFALVFLLTLPAYLYFSWYLRQTPPKYNAETLIVLGAGIFSEEVSPLLKARLDAAYTIHQPSTHWIVSGGQGADEPISEALAMQCYLISLGVPASQVTLEDRSTNTHENMVFSKPFMQSKTKCVVVTSDFHLLRALRIAQRVSIVANGYGALSPLRYRARSYIRDYCGLLLHHPYVWGIFILLQLVTTLFNY
ncbi:membrane protein [Staphylococcus microti]|uniref:Membrane protein n=1 Tax=Staphylococcus microti TaxID=569857 RepID=A0A380GX55_9STAP|nr:YdcF family protein [Staphylococcus microti]PNZ77073.1 YdcF family protein [Staphylococcus microti]SUM58310.1 membrane protein [Staphylococcus microti]